MSKTYEISHMYTCINRTFNDFTKVPDQFFTACVINVTIAELFVTNEGQNALHVDHENR